MRVHHIALRTDRVMELADFYRRAFGFPCVRSTLPQSIWLEIGPESVLMIEAAAADEPRPNTNSKELIAFGVGAQEKARVRAFALEHKCFDGESEHTIYLRDPQGRRVAASTYPLPASPSIAEEPPEQPPTT